MIRAEADRNFTFRQVFDIAGVTVREAGRRDHARPRRRAGRQVGGRPRPARLHGREEAAGRGLLSRQHLHRRAHADDQGQQVGGHTFGISPHGTHFLYWKDNRFQAYDLERRHGEDARQRHGGQLHRHRGRPSRHQAVLRTRRLHQRRQGGDRAAPLRPVADAARRLVAEEPDQRRRREERDPLPLRARSNRSTRRCRAPSVRAARSISRSRSCSRPTVSGRRSPASTS